MVGLGDPAGNRQGQPSAAPIVLCTGTSLVSAEEALENPRLQVGGDASSSIRDAQRVFQFYATAGHVNASTLRSVLDRVIQQIENHPPQEGFVSVVGVNTVRRLRA